MPQINAGRASVSQAGKSTGKRRVKRARANAPVTVAPADRVQERSTVRNTQIAKSKSASPDRQDTKRSPAQKQRDAKIVAGNVKVSLRKAVDRQKSVGDGGPVTYTAAYAKHKAERAAVAAKVQAPVLKVLDQTTRPLHAVATGADAAVTHKNVLNAAKRGIQNKDKTTFSTVLKHAGVKNKYVRGGVGFALDVGLDPTTYLTGGTGSIAAKAADKAAAKATRKALSAGLTQEQAAKFGERAATQATKTADKTTGVTVKVAGHEVPGVRKATAKASKPARATGRAVTTKKVRAAVRNVAADVNPNVAPAGVSRETSRKAAQATRTARSKTNQGGHEAEHLAYGIRTVVGEKNYNQIVDAIEAGKIGKLPAELRGHAVTLRSQFRHIRRVERRAGVPVGDATKGGKVKGYVYRQLTDAAKEADGKAATKRGGLKPPSSKTRTEKRPLAEVRVAKPGRYREDLHALAGERLEHGRRAAAKADLNRALADLGTPVKRGHVPVVKDGEAVFHIKEGKPAREVTDRAELARATAPLVLNKAGTKVKNATPKKAVGGGRYVVLNRDIVKRAEEGAAPELAGHGIVKGYDKATSGFKRVALATPGFHIRNIVGDTSQAYVHQPGQKLAGNMIRAGRVLKAATRADKAQRDLGRAVEGTGRLKTPKYGHVSYEEAARQLIQHGAARSGYSARELSELSTSGGVKEVGKIRGALRGARKSAGNTRGGQAGKRVMLNREDLPRLATALAAVRSGSTWEEAAQKVADVHIDYAHLTSFERNLARRLAPFYTWTARNVPIQTKAIVQRPGKYAAYQKLREEATTATQPGEIDPKTQDLYKQLEAGGVKLDGGWEKYLTEYEQRNAGVPVSWKGTKFTVSMGLPLQDLNELPGFSGRPMGQIGEWANKAASLANPIPKDVAEYALNYSFFFRDQIERDNSPLVSAPSTVGKFSPAMKKRLGVVKAEDKRSGKMVWMWPGKVDYIAHVVPGLPAQAVRLTTPGHDRVGKGKGAVALGIAGVKATPVDARTNAINLSYARLQEIAKRKSSLNQQGIGVKQGNVTAEYRKLLDQEKVLRRIAYQGKQQRGDAKLPSQGGPAKPRGGSGRVKVPGVGGRVKVPGVGGRVKVP